MSLATMQPGTRHWANRTKAQRSAVDPHGGGQDAHHRREGAVLQDPQVVIGGVYRADARHMRAGIEAHGRTEGLHADQLRRVQLFVLEPSYFQSHCVLQITAAPTRHRGGCEGAASYEYAGLRSSEKLRYATSVSPHLRPRPGHP